MSADPDELRAKIAQEREALGETAAVLAARADLVGRAKDTARQTADSTRETAATAVAQAKEHGTHAMEKATTWGHDAVAKARSGEDRKPLFIIGAVAGALFSVAVARAVRGR